MTRDAAGERDSKELNSIATLLNLEYDDVAIGWWLPAEPGPILCASVADAVREALRLADNDCRRATAALSTAERERDELEREYRELCLVLRTAVERHNLGLGGERLEALLIQALDERTAALRHILRVYELPDVGPLEDAVERARASLARVPSGGA